MFLHLSVCPQVGSASMHAGIPPPPRSRHHTGAGIPQKQAPPREQTPPRAGTPREQTPPPPGSRHPPPADGYCCGRYASYWNTFLLSTAFTSIPAPIILFQLFYQRIWYYLYINKFNNIIVTETNEK